MFLPTNKEIYESGITRAKELTIAAIEEFSDLVVQLSMANEFADVSDLLNFGDEVTFSVGDFLETKDPNVKSIIKILNCLRDFDSLQNPNV